MKRKPEPPAASSTPAIPAAVDRPSPTPAALPGALDLGRWRSPPAELVTDAARDWWPKVVAELRNRNRLHLCIPHQVGQFCELLGQWWAITNRISQRKGRQVDECILESGLIKRTVSPEVRVQLDLLNALRQLAKDFGLNEPPLNPGTNGKTGSTNPVLAAAQAALDARRN